MINMSIVIFSSTLLQLFLTDEGQVISVYDADYGRTDQTTCSYKRPASQTGNIDCINPTSKVAERYSCPHFVNLNYRLKALEIRLNFDAINFQLLSSLYSLISLCLHSCGGKNNCTIEASNSVFGDPCYGIYKYLEVAYVCQCK